MRSYLIKKASARHSFSCAHQELLLEKDSVIVVGDFNVCGQELGIATWLNHGQNG